MRALAVAAVLAVLAAGWSGWSWWSAERDAALAVAAERDAVLAAVSDALVTLHTIDHRTAEADVGKWLAVTTGRLGEDLSGDRRLQLDRAEGTRTVATATLVDAVVTELDRQEGTARLGAVLDVRVSAEGEPEGQRRSRLLVDATRTAEGWKVSSVQAAGR
ncbi:Mce-associated membrane protein [Prauserella shujinwangii]|uniref:Mce-associated membrane protein n=1 Tax=Prauserella shujinwangii TaxID=1453103 RepID=A0A2T0LS49_9PSEU|nr:hypothetical protein [Prauserella shujinwangii]PRX46474.1 Mce-associated membrane protein [Prauserella shujinwangii]